MLATRRQAALGLLAAGGAVALPHAGAWAQVPEAIVPDIPDDEPHTELDTLQGRDSHLLAPVTINGQGPFFFLLDTGANVSCVSHRLVETLALAPGPPTRVHTVVGVRERPSVLIEHLQVGARNRRRIHAPSLPMRSHGVDGVLGIDWLKGQRLVLDFKNKSLEITKSRRDESEPNRVVVVPARRRHGQLTIVDADLSGRRISAIIDSGAEMSLCNRPLRELVRAAERRRNSTEEPRFIRMESLAGEVFRAESLFLPFLRLGGLHLGNVPVAYADMHVFDIWGLKESPALVLGMDLLTQFESVALDFGRSAVRFDFAQA